MSTTRQNKVSRLLQRDLSEIFQQLSKDKLPGVIITVTKVRITADLSIARVYLSIFPADNAAALIKDIQLMGGEIKYALVKRIRHQIKNMPELEFYIDDSLDYIENIERLLND